MSGPIARKLTLAVLALAFAFGLLFISAEIYVGYRVTMNRTSRHLQAVRERHAPTVTDALWRTDYARVQADVEAIALHPEVTYAEVVSSEGKTFAAGTPVEGRRLESGRLLFRERRGQSVEVGTLTLYADMSHMAREAITERIPHALFSLTTAVVLAVAISVFFRRWVARRLKTIGAALERDDEQSIAHQMEELQPGPTSGSEDEVTQLVDSINEMRNRLRRSLDEKELMIREMHHRLRNHMVSVISVLRLQYGSVADPQARQALGTALNRVNAVAVLYERLQYSGSADRASTALYVRSLVDAIQAAVLEDSRVAIQADVEDTLLDTKRLSWIGMIINELVTNSVKHAFPGGRDGTIRISLRHRDPATMELRHVDNGVGLDSAHAESRSGDPQSGGLGMLLVSTLTEQMGGTLTVISTAGTDIYLHFPVTG
jgi:two-component sensor histidine kinase